LPRFLLPTAAAATASLLVGLWPPTLHRLPAADYGRGPSLRCVRLRRIHSLPPASALPNRAVLSHPLRGAYRAIVPGRNVRGRGEFGRLVLGCSSTTQCSGPFAGESFSPAPPFPPCAGLSFPVGCAAPTAAATPQKVATLRPRASGPAFGGLRVLFGGPTLRSSVRLRRTQTCE